MPGRIFHDQHVTVLQYRHHAIIRQVLLDDTFDFLRIGITNHVGSDRGDAAFVTRTDVVGLDDEIGVADPLGRIAACPGSRLDNIPDGHVVQVQRYLAFDAVVDQDIDLFLGCQHGHDFRDIHIEHVDTDDLVEIRNSHAAVKDQQQCPDEHK